MPLSLTTEEMDLLLTLAAPIEQRQRNQFLHEVAAEPGRPLHKQVSGPALACRIGSDASFRGNISTRPSCQTRRRASAAPKGRSSKLEHYGRGRDYRSSSVLAFSHRPALVPQRKHRWAWPGCSWC
jgi:hypothetical protein